MVKIAILGYCCTGDIFRLSPAGFKLVLYGSGTSLLSQMTPPVPIRERDVQLTERFERRMVVDDFRKTFLTDLARARPDYLLLDFGYEGVPVARVLESYITYSGFTVLSGIREASGYDFTVLDRTDPAVLAQWEQCCQAFIRRLSAILPAERVILHRAFWQHQYRDGADIMTFSPEFLAEGAYRNDLMQRCHAYFAAACPGCRSLDINAAGFIGDKSHTWGLRPSHYETGYYLRAANVLREMMGLAPEPGE